jgi:hypothetical protein
MKVFYEDYILLPPIKSDSNTSPIGGVWFNPYITVILHVTGVMCLKIVLCWAQMVKDYYGL